MRQVAVIDSVRYFFRHSIFGIAAPILAAVIGALALPEAASAQSLTNPTYTREQAAAGKAAYPNACASCHGANLDDGELLRIELREAFEVLRNLFRTAHARQ